MAGIDPKQYISMIVTLSNILEQRDGILEKYIAEGSQKVVEYTNKSGATNLIKNPLLMLWMDLNMQALTYWKELGLTPAGYKKLFGDKPVEKNSPLVEALRSLGA